MSSSTPVVKRWRRFGYDRLYVTQPDGEEIGWADLRTDQVCAASLQELPVLTDAVGTWKARNNWNPSGMPLVVPAASTAAVRREPATTPLTDRAAGTCLPRDAVRCWTDLSTNVPGAEARKQALLLRNAAPIRTFFARLFNRRTDERAWRIGADGEEMVAAELAQLCRWNPSWRVLHAVKVGTRGTDIDHVVVGPGGVFTLNTKHHPGARIWVGGDTVMVNGWRAPYVPKSRHEAGRAAKLLTAAAGFSVQVQGVIVPVRAQGTTIAAPPSDVSVVPSKRIVPWLIERGAVLDHPTCSRIFEVARWSTTWQPLDATVAGR